VNFINFTGQVLSYLLPEYQDYYNSETVWKSIQTEVVALLERIFS